MLHHVSRLPKSAAFAALALIALAWLLGCDAGGEGTTITSGPGERSTTTGSSVPTSSSDETPATGEVINTDYGDTTTEVPASSSTSLNPAGGPVDYEHLDRPLLVASAERGDLEARWQELSAVAVEVNGGLAEGMAGSEGPSPVATPGFEPFNDPHIALSDGRFIVRGIWSGDEPIASWSKWNDEATGPGGQDSPVEKTSGPPVRLFVYDPATKDIKPVSHFPQLRAYQTATHEGEGPDTVIAVMVLPGEKLVAYTSGFAGAAYEIPYELYVAPIPPPAS